jgi:RNA-binding protein YlmH
VPQGLLLAAAAAKGNKYPNLDAFCAEQEAKAVAASESWIVDATGFLEPSESAAVSEKLEGRADVSCLSVGLYRKGQGRRSRCVFSNPDLGYDAATAEADYVSYLKIDNVIPSQCDPWPNVLVNIGLSLDTVGDVLVVVNQATVYLAVAPESSKVCTRLLPKELPGTGVTVTSVSRDELDSELTDISDSDGMVVDNMEVQRVDKRK